jgi:hypothetical protein
VASAAVAATVTPAAVRTKGTAVKRGIKRFLFRFYDFYDRGRNEVPNGKKPSGRVPS